jgi:hypothetical protein
VAHILRRCDGALTRARHAHGDATRGGQQEMTGAAGGMALSRSRVLLVNREVGSKAESRKINDLVNLKSRQIPSKIAYSWPV